MLFFLALPKVSGLYFDHKKGCVDEKIQENESRVASETTTLWEHEQESKQKDTYVMEI